MHAKHHDEEKGDFRRPASELGVRNPTAIRLEYKSPRLTVLGTFDELTGMATKGSDAGDSLFSYNR